MESTDSTLSIAESYGCKIVTFPRPENAIVEQAREFAISSGSHEWALVVDADELVPQELRDYLYDFISSRQDYTGLLIPHRNLFMNRFMHGIYPDYHLRFFKREGVSWPDVIHSVPSVKGNIAKIPASRKELAFIHLCDMKLNDYFRKQNGYTEQELERRKNKKYGAGALLFRPMFRFIKAYILKGGFRDGLPGLIFARTESVYQVMLVSKILEKKIRKGKPLNSQR